MLYDAWIAEYHRVRRHIYIHEAARCYQHIVANGDVPHYCRVDSDPHPVANHRSAFPKAPVCLTYDHPFVNVAVLSDSGPGINCDVISVT